MKPFLSVIWRRLPSDIATRIETCIKEACTHLTDAAPGAVYFRADDVAVPGRQYYRMMELFAKYRAPLSIAVVPAWLTPHRWDALQKTDLPFSSIWCWHQHGWRHLNHVKEGRNQEFGPGRLLSDIKHDLLKGRQRLQNILGHHFYPVFTPPWNRCSLETLLSLKEFGYHAVSRNFGALPPPPENLPDLCVDVDLHTRKDKDPPSGWGRLFKSLKKDISSGRCGIVLHHQKMNAAAFDFLDMLLNTLNQSKMIELVNFKDLLK